MSTERVAAANTARGALLETLQQWGPGRWLDQGAMWDRVLARFPGLPCEAVDAAVQALLDDRVIAARWCDDRGRQFRLVRLRAVSEPRCRGRRRRPRRLTRPQLEVRHRRRPR
jgi:hypothetical protein